MFNVFSENVDFFLLYCLEAVSCYVFVNLNCVLDVIIQSTKGPKLLYTQLCKLPHYPL